MKSAMLDNSSRIEPAQQLRHASAQAERPLTVEQLAGAVGEHALLQAEIDQKMATRIVELRDELSAAKEEIRSLRAHIDQLVHGLSQGLGLAQRQPANATRASQPSSLASLRSR